MDAVVNPPLPNEPSYELFQKVITTNTFLTLFVSWVIC